MGFHGLAGIAHEVGPDLHQFALIGGEGLGAAEVVLEFHPIEFAPKNGEGGVNGLIDDRKLFTQSVAGPQLFEGGYDMRRLAGGYRHIAQGCPQFPGVDGAP